ncbi:Sjogren's syndrome/scleroderma autoantigen 1 family protein [Haloplanus sp. C73]|uniref:Sjogren's syndrome/scleroderma autoantigen 1 family protein n=1 Tax=Haloplanus sp. C73 TaxID=3421641 RepID=UPI003EB7FA5D
MSGFDEEAERERLREKYEENQEERAATQRMSELLLKGATMTNSHCDTCGDPLFRHDGQTFCPTCQAANGDQTADAEQVADAERQPAEAETTAETADAPTPATPDTSRSRPTGDVTPAENGTAPTRRTSAEGDDPRSTARASLSRTLVKYTRAAEETDDPRRAKELLAAAREAAETLSALD